MKGDAKVISYLNRALKQELTSKTVHQRRQAVSAAFELGLTSRGTGRRVPQRSCENQPGRGAHNASFDYHAGTDLSRGPQCGAWIGRRRRSADSVPSAERGARIHRPRAALTRELGGEQIHHPLP